MDSINRGVSKFMELEERRMTMELEMIERMRKEDLERQERLRREEMHHEVRLMTLIAGLFQQTAKTVRIRFNVVVMDIVSSTLSLRFYKV